MEHPQLRRQLFHCFIIVIVRKFLLPLSLALLTQPAPARWAPIQPSEALQNKYPPSPPQALQCSLGISPQLGSLGALSASGGWGSQGICPGQSGRAALPWSSLLWGSLAAPAPLSSWQNQWRLVSGSARWADPSCSASYLTPVHLTFPTFTSLLNNIF